MRWYCLKEREGDGVTGFLRALRFGWRTLMRNRSTSLVAIAALTLGIAANVAVFTVVERVLLRPLNLPHSERYRHVWRTLRSNGPVHWPFSYLNLRDMARRNKTFAALGGITAGSDLNLTVGSPERVEAREITSDLPAAFEVKPALGQWFPSDATAAGQTNSAMLAWSLWKRLGADPHIVGSMVRLNDKPYTVAGVLPAWFRLPVHGAERVQVILPLDSTTVEARERGNHFLLGVGKMRPGVTPEQAQADLINVAAALEREYPNDNAENTVSISPILEAITTPEFRETVWSLLAAVGLVLLVACCNVASLLLARSVVRTKETSLRVALGANRAQLASPFVAEGLILSLISGGLGVALSLAIIRLIFALAPDRIPRGEEIQIDGIVVLFSIVVAVLMGLLCSLVPLIHAQRQAPHQVLNDGARSSTAYRGRRTLRALVAGEVALAFLLLTAALGRFSTLDRLRKTPLGFDPTHVLTTQLFLSPGRYPDDAALAQQQRRILEAVAAVPGVQKVGSIDILPIRAFGTNYHLFVDGLPSKPATELEWVEVRAASEDYYPAMGIPLRAGRLFSGADAKRGSSVAIINEAAARAYWHGRSPLGTFVRLGDPDSKERVEIIGVIADIRNAQLQTRPLPEIDLFYSQVADPDMALAVRSSLPVSALVPRLEQAVHQLDARQPLFSTMTMQEVINESLTQERLVATMVELFASIAVLLAMLGIYSVVAYSVAERVPEIGTRMALGAGANHVLSLILKDALTMVAGGLAIGSVLTLGSSAMMRHADFTLKPWWASFLAAVTSFTSGPSWTFALAALAVGGATVLTCLIPAYRATLVDPMVAVRNDLRSVWRQSRERLFKLAAFVAPREADAMETSVITELAEANRQSKTVDAQLQTTVEVLRRTFAARNGWLLARNDQGEYPCVATTAEESEPPVGLAANSKLVQRLKRYGAPLPITAGDIDATIRYYEQYGIADVEDWRLMDRLGATLAVKIALRDELIGVLLLAPEDAQKDFSHHDREVLKNLSLQLALILENSNLARRAVEEEKLRRDLSLATEVQKRLFPDQAPKRDSLTLAGACIPARGVGGDYYDFFDLGPDKTGIALADVAGKGIAAALVMSVVQASLRVLATETHSTLAEIAARMNKLMLRSTSNSGYATFFYAEIDEAKHRLRYVNAGHNPPMLFRGLFAPAAGHFGEAAGSGGEVGSATRQDGGTAVAKPEVCEELKVGGLVIGLFAMAAYEEAEVTLEPGDVLVVFTDGVSEALNPAGEEYGEERIREAVYARANLSAAELTEELMVELKTWIAEAPQHDDMTLLIARMG